MGFSLDLVLSDDGHVSEFVCVICSGLVEYPVMTHCTHVFCKTCLAQWLPRRAHCPRCNTFLGLQADGRCEKVSDLRTASPLAWRILSRIRCRCPLQEATGCSWTGEFSEVQSHLTNSGDHTGREPIPRLKAIVGEENVALVMDDTAAESTEEPQNDASVAKPGDGPASDPMVTARALKAEADNRFSAQEYGDAIRLYTKAISVAPDFPQLYANRAAALLMQGQIARFRSCVQDCDRALALEPGFERAYIRKARALVALGAFDDAANCLSDASENCEKSTALDRELQKVAELQRTLQVGTQKCASGDFADGRAILGSMLRQTNAPGVVLAVVRAELGLGFTERPLRLTLQLLRQDRSHAAVYTARGRAFLLDGDFQGAEELLREGLRLDPESEEAKSFLRACKKIGGATQSARKAIFTRKFREGVEKFTEALVYISAAHARLQEDNISAESDTSDASAEELSHLPGHAKLVAKLFGERANAYLRVKELPLALRDTARALRAQPDCRDALLTRASVLQSMGRHEQAAQELMPIIETWGAHDVSLRHAFDRAVLEKRKAMRPDYYGILGVRKVASEMEIKKAYKIAALKYHPDRHSRESEADQREKAKMFQIVGEALEVLTDPFKRSLFDDGYDLEAINERAEAARRAARSNNHGYHGR